MLKDRNLKVWDWDTVHVFVLTVLNDMCIYSLKYDLKHLS